MRLMVIIELYLNFGYTWLYHITFIGRVRNQRCLKNYYTGIKGAAIDYPEN